MKKYPSLVAAFVLFAALAAFLCHFYPERKAGADFIDRIIRNRGDVRGKHNGENVDFSRYSFSPDKSFEIDSINIRNIMLEKSDFMSILPLPNLTLLSLESVEFKDGSLEPLKNCFFEILHFEKCQLDYKTGKEVAGIKRINSLSLENIAHVDAFFEGCSNIKIKTFLVGNCTMSTNALKKMLPLDFLEEVIFMDVRLQDDIHEFFDQCPKLKYIAIHGAEIKCEFIAKMQHPEKIERIKLSDTLLDDEILPSLPRFKELNIFEANNCRITDKSKPLLESLVKNLYKTTVVQDGLEIINETNKDRFFINLDEFNIDDIQ